MRNVFAMALALCASAQNSVNQDSLIFQDFDRRVADYVKLHRAMRAKIGALKPTPSRAAIDEHEHALARAIGEARAGARQGDIFTPRIAGKIRELIGKTMHSSEAGRVQESMRRAEPVNSSAIRVNGSYPAGVPLQSTPPTLLLNLPPLPPEVEYRVIGHRLILLDTEANLIVDWIGDAIP